MAFAAIVTLALSRKACGRPPYGAPPLRPTPLRAMIARDLAQCSVASFGAGPSVLGSKIGAPLKCRATTLRTGPASAQAHVVRVGLAGVRPVFGQQAYVQFAQQAGNVIHGRLHLPTGAASDSRTH